VGPDLTGPSSGTVTQKTYDDEMLGTHYVAGDGRTNENIGLTAIHPIFHSEHDRLVDETTATLNLPENAALKAAFENVLDHPGQPDLHPGRAAVPAGPIHHRDGVPGVRPFARRRCLLRDPVLVSGS
jgi:hypothetical protein